MTQAEDIRNLVIEKYINPARNKGYSSVKVIASEVHSAVGLDNRFPAVCSAMDTNKFLIKANVTLIDRTGVHQGSNIEWTFKL